MLVTRACALSGHGKILKISAKIHFPGLDESIPSETQRGVYVRAGNTVPKFTMNPIAETKTKRK